MLGTGLAKLARSKLMALVSRTGKIGSHQLTCWAGAPYQTSRCQGKANAIPDGQVPLRERCARLRHVVMRVLGIEPRLRDDRADEFP